MDVGCQWPFAINNTALLEELGWRGIALDREDFADKWPASRHLFKGISVEHNEHKGRNHIEAECEPQRRLLDALGYDWIFTTCMGLSQTTRSRIA